MQVSVEKISNVERRLTIIVPANTVEEAYAEQINKFAKNANIKGFRPGKAPKDVIDKRYGNDARMEALNKVIQKALFDAITAEKLRPINTPSVEPKMMLANQPLEFVATFEVLPEIENIQCKLDNIEKLKVEVKPEDVEYVVEQLRKQYTKWQVVERAATERDRIVIDYYAVFEGQADQENKIQNFPLELGSEVMLPGFEKGLVGSKAGEERTLNLSFPEDFPVKERVGKQVDFVVQVKEVYQADAPELNQDFIKKLGVKSGQLEELKDQIKQSLEFERDRLIKERLKEQVFSKMLEQNPIDVPKSLIERESKNIHDEVYQHKEHDHQHSEKELAAFSDVAAKRVALGLLIAEYAKKTNLKADKDRVIARIKEIATIYENPKEVMAWLSSEDRLAGIEAQVMEDQVMEKLIEGVPATEKSMSYAELKGIRG